MTSYTVTPETVRTWNARRGLARACEQLRQNLDETVDTGNATVPMVEVGMENVNAAVAELRAAEQAAGLT
jgi:hypothetical protein